MPYSHKAAAAFFAFLIGYGIGNIITSRRSVASQPAKPVPAQAEEHRNS